SERIPESQVVLEIEVEPERLERSLERAYRRLAQKAEVPGFRRGKAPAHMLERYLGRDAVMQEALGLLIPEVYNQAIEEENIDAIDRPSIEVVQEEPLILKATVPVRPSVDLGEYREVRVEREPVRVSEEQVDEEIEELRHRYAILEPVDRPLQTGDMVRADIRVSVDGRSVFSEDDAEFRLRQGMPVLLPGFAEQLPGSEKGVEREFSIDVPQDYPQRPLAGKTCLCKVLVKEIKEEKLAELDDAFAAIVGEGFPSLEALRERLELDVRQSAEQEADARYREKVVDGVVAGASVEFPPVLAEREMEQLLRERLSASGAGDIERYLKQVGRSEEELRQELRLQAVERIQNSLVLGKVAEVEGISVGKEDIDAEIERLAASSGPRADEMRKVFSSAGAREALKRSLFTRKTVERLVAIASGDVSPPAAEAAEEVGKSEVHSKE
ncbi:MAG: trigger factor, partial [Dehalococcoidia bacterium]|nr:trigger factor [Dehalococcoidia bacterium]